MTRVLPVLLLALLGGIGGLATVAAGEDTPAQTITVTRTENVRVVSSYQGRKADWWARRTWYWKRRSIALKRTLLDRPQVSEAINLACVTYSVSCGLMWSLARCESGLYAGAKNPTSDASGLFQMLLVTIPSLGVDSRSHGKQAESADADSDLASTAYGRDAG